MTKIYSILTKKSYYALKKYSIILSSTLKKDKVAVTLVSTGFPPLLISKKMLYGNATLKYF